VERSLGGTALGLATGKGCIQSWFGVLDGIRVRDTLHVFGFCCLVVILGCSLWLGLPWSVLGLLNYNHHRGVWAACVGKHLRGEQRQPMGRRAMAWPRSIRMDENEAHGIFYVIHRLSMYATGPRGLKRE